MTQDMKIPAHMILHNISLIPNKILMKLWTTWLAGAYERSCVSHISLNCSNSAAEIQSRDLFEKHLSDPLSKNICNILLCFSCWYPKAVLPRFAVAGHKELCEKASTNALSPSVPNANTCASSRLQPISVLPK